MTHKRADAINPHGTRRGQAGPRYSEWSQRVLAEPTDCVRSLACEWLAILLAALAGEPVQDDGRGTRIAGRDQLGTSRRR